MKQHLFFPTGSSHSETPSIPHPSFLCLSFTTGHRIQLQQIRVLNIYLQLLVSPPFLFVLFSLGFSLCSSPWLLSLWAHNKEGLCHYPVEKMAEFIPRCVGDMSPRLRLLAEDSFLAFFLVTSPSMPRMK